MFGFYGGTLGRGPRPEIEVDVSFFSPQHHTYASVAESAGEKIEAQQQVRKEAGLRYSFGFACAKLRGLAFSLFFSSPHSFSPHCVTNESSFNSIQAPCEQGATLRDNEERDRCKLEHKTTTSNHKIFHFLLFIHSLTGLTVKF